jgi:hypothetical protein
MISIENPYIHGTTSKVLDIMIHTDFSLMEPIYMIEKYGVAPQTGEITGGGFDTVSCRCNPCFGRVSHGSCNYNLENVIGYTQINKKSESSDVKSELIYQLELGAKCAYSNINIILIYAVRCQQVGYNILDIITQDIISDIKNTINAMSSLLFIGTMLRPVENFNDGYVADAIYTHLTLAHLKNKCSNLPNLYDLYRQYINEDIGLISQEHIDMISDIFILSKKCTVKSGFLCVDKEVELSITHPFTNTAPEYCSCGSYFEPRYTLYRLSQNVSSYRINDVLEKYFQGTVSENFWPIFHKNLCKYLDDFIHRSDLLSKIINRDNIICLKNQDTIEYPIIFICEDVQLIESFRSEYRAKRPLKLGVDIITIATDNDSNKQLLEKYIESHNLKCKVILFKDLKSIN